MTESRQVPPGEMVSHVQAAIRAHLEEHQHYSAQLSAITVCDQCQQLARLLQKWQAEAMKDVRIVEGSITVTEDPPTRGYLLIGVHTNQRRRDDHQLQRLSVSPSRTRS